MKYIATLSGGKDSTVMCDLLLKNNYPVDYIIFNDTLLEFSEMYQYIDKVDDYFQQRYNKSITRLKPVKDFEEGVIFNRKTKGKYKGQISGLLSPNLPTCHWRQYSKIAPNNKFFREKGIKKYKLYIGFTTNECHRAKWNHEHFLYPLITDFKMSERDCKEYLIEHDMENPLYRHFNRTGCRICPFQSKKQLYKIYKYYSSVWQEIKNLEKKVIELSKKDRVLNIYPFNNNNNTWDLEKEFKKIDNQGSLFDFSDEPVRDCFCKI